MQVKRSCSPDSAFGVLTILDDFCLSVCQPVVDALAICVLPLEHAYTLIQSYVLVVLWPGGESKLLQRLAAVSNSAGTLVTL